MLKSKRTTAILAAIVIFSMAAMYGMMPAVKAGTMEKAEDTISDSDTGASNVTHTIKIDMVNDLAAGEIITLEFESGLDISSATTTCPANTTALDPSGQYLYCMVDAGHTLSSTTEWTITVTDAANPLTSKAYTVTISTNNAIEAETAEAMVYIIDNVTVTAHIPATLSFSIAGLATSSAVNTVTTTGSTTATEIAFGSIPPDTQKIMGQLLNVSTNATDGFTVTVQQDHNLETAAGSDIDTFANGVVASSTWTAPSAQLGQEQTYGHMGITSDDDSLTDGNDYGDGIFTGFNGTNPLEVMYHNGPADGQTAHIGSTTVAYAIEISDLQEAGDYENSLTYICTPTY